MCAHCPEPESGLLFCQRSISSVSALSCRYSVHANYHRAFREKYNLPFTLIADTDKSINQRYGVWVERERDGKKLWDLRAPLSSSMRRVRSPTSLKILTRQITRHRSSVIDKRLYSGENS